MQMAPGAENWLGGKSEKTDERGSVMCEENAARFANSNLPSPVSEESLPSYKGPFYSSYKRAINIRSI